MATRALLLKIPHDLGGQPLTRCIAATRCSWGLERRPFNARPAGRTGVIRLRTIAKVTMKRRSSFEHQDRGRYARKVDQDDRDDAHTALQVRTQSPKSCDDNRGQPQLRRIRKFFRVPKITRRYCHHQGKLHGGKYRSAAANGLSVQLPRRVQIERWRRESCLKFLARVGRPPARRFEPDAPLVCPRRRLPRCLHERPVFRKDCPAWIPTSHGYPRSVDARLFFLHESPEHPVPDHKHATVVLVEVLVVDRMMHTMVRWRRKHAIEPAKFADVFSVNPELVQEDDKPGQAKLFRRYAYQRNGQIEDPAN